jgi:hypothetical protein
MSISSWLPTLVQPRTWCTTCTWRSPKLVVSGDGTSTTGASLAGCMHSLRSQGRGGEPSPRRYQTKDIQRHCSKLGWPRVVELSA